MGSQSFRVGEGAPVYWRGRFSVWIRSESPSAHLTYSGNWELRKVCHEGEDQSGSRQEGS